MTSRLFAAELAQSRPAHAYLLTGPDQARLGEAVVLLAQALNCRRPGPDGPCGSCSACDEIARGVFPDLHFGEAKHKLADVKALLALLAERPIGGGKRVVVLPGVPEMTREAQNVLLKTLEEPPQGSVLVLIAAGLDGILPTVISRCRHVPIPGSTGDEVATRLHEEGFDPRTVGFASLAAGGDLAAARRLAARDDLAQLRLAAVDFVGGLLGPRREAPLEMVEKHASQLSSGDGAGDWIAAVRGILRGVISAAAGQPGLLAGAVEPAELQAVSEVPVQYAVALVEAINAVEYAIARHAAARLTLEAAILEMDEQLSIRH